MKHKPLLVLSPTNIEKRSQAFTRLPPWRLHRRWPSHPPAQPRRCASCRKKRQGYCSAATLLPAKASEIRQASTDEWNCRVGLKPACRLPESCAPPRSITPQPLDCPKTSG